MNFFLVRHGEAAASWSEDPDPGLSDLGRQQALTAAQQLFPLLGEEFQLVSSPLARAQETAQPLASICNTPVLINEAFREIPSPVSLEQRQGWLRQFMGQQWHEQPQALKEWRGNLLQELESFERSTVIFTHFLVINAVVGSLLNQPETLCCWPDNGSVTTLSLEGGHLSLVELGQQIETHVN